MKRNIFIRTYFGYIIIFFVLMPISAYCKSELPIVTETSKKTLNRCSKAVCAISMDISKTTPGFYNAYYTSKDGLTLRTGTTEKVSYDNGRTWEKESIKPIFRMGLPKGYRRQDTSSILDTSTNRFVSIIVAMDTPDLDPKLRDPLIVLKKTYLRYLVSTDGVKTWLFDEPIFQRGRTQETPFEGISFGLNSFYIGDLGCKPIITKKGKIMLAVQVTSINPDGDKLVKGVGDSYFDVMVLNGTWTNDNHISWTASQRVKGDPKSTTRGLFEPTLAQFPDGRILMVMRGSNGGRYDRNFKFPSYKWFSVSDDEGKTWSHPKPWNFEDGETMYSPSSMSALFKHSSGRYFWVGNISASNCKGNSPRFPIVIGEINPQSLKIIRQSVLTIDTEGYGDIAQGRLDLSHVTILEDRETKEIITVYPRYHNAYKLHEFATVRLKVK